MSQPQRGHLRTHLDVARQMLTAGLIDEAHRQIAEALRVDPGCSEARLLEAQLHHARHDAHGVIHALDAHDQYHPHQRTMPSVLLLRAEAYARQGRAPLAITLASRLCEQYPDDVRGHRLLAALALHAERSDMACTHLRHVLRLEPSDKAAARVLAHLLGETNPQDALDLLLHDTPPADVESLLHVVRLLRGVWRHRDAEDLLIKALADRPGDASLWLEFGRLSDEVGALALARQRLERAVALGAGRAGRAALARTLMHSGALRPAGGIWWQLARADDADVEAWCGLTVCALAVGRLSLADRARAMLETRMSRIERRRALAAMWHDAAVGLAITRARSGERDEQPESASQLAALLDAARQTLARHARQHPKRADTHYHLAVCQSETGRVEEARLSLETARTINPRYEAARRLAEQLDPLVPRAA